MLQYSDRDYLIGDKELTFRGMPLIYDVTTSGLIVGMTVSTNTRYGMSLEAGSVMIGKWVKRVTVLIQRTSAGITGTILARIRDSGDAVKGTSQNSLDSNSGLALDATLLITFVFTNPVQLALSDKILLEYDGVPTSTVTIHHSLDAFDGVRTKRVRYEGGYTLADVDITGSVSSR